MGVCVCVCIFMLCCQFEATDARLALPCWDEPAFKATFDVTLTVDASLTALSNMPVVSEVVDGGLKTCVYGRTPVMSTYLLAFVVGELEKSSGVTGEGVEVNVYTTPGKKEVRLCYGSASFGRFKWPQVYGAHAFQCPIILCKYCLNAPS